MNLATHVFADVGDQEAMTAIDRLKIYALWRSYGAKETRRIISWIEPFLTDGGHCGFDAFNSRW